MGVTFFPQEVPGERRCLEWDSTQYSRHFFKKHCQLFDANASALNIERVGRINRIPEGAYRLWFFADKV